MKAKSADINTMFGKFYLNFYTAHSQHNQECLETFFQGLDLPRLSESQKSDIDHPQTFFEFYANELTPLLLRMHHEAFLMGI